MALGHLQRQLGVGLGAAAYGDAAVVVVMSMAAMGAENVVVPASAP